jgi:hypothetical protein
MSYSRNVCGFLYSVFESVTAVAFQSIFYLEMHQKNKFFYFLKIVFDISTSKWFKNTNKILFWNNIFKM